MRRWPAASSHHEKRPNPLLPIVLRAESSTLDLESKAMKGHVILHNYWAWIKARWASVAAVVGVLSTVQKAMALSGAFLIPTVIFRHWVTNIAWPWLLARIPVPRAILLGLSVGLLSFICASILRWRRRRFFNNFLIDGVRWRWIEVDRWGQPNYLSPHCENCDVEMAPTYKPIERQRYWTVLECNYCDGFLGTHEGFKDMRPDDVEDRARRIIVAEIRKRS